MSSHVSRKAWSNDATWLANCTSLPPRSGSPDYLARDSWHARSSRRRTRAAMTSDTIGRSPVQRPCPPGGAPSSGRNFLLEWAIEAVYPLALVHQRQHRDGTLRLVSLDEVLSRQSGRYESTSALSAQGRALAIETVCGECVRKPVWVGAECSGDEIPCPEPCSVLVAFCREAALWEAERPDGAPADNRVAWAAFDEPGNELRERFLQEMATVDD